MNVAFYRSGSDILSAAFFMFNDKPSSLFIRSQHPTLSPQLSVKSTGKFISIQINFSCFMPTESMQTGHFNLIFC
ncbi:hypothetical protein DIY08_07635 [Shewanella xiamenensis]|nr:hypothetical protein DIY08_07635 [Shewanella xiamenensis]